jgi:hypothetical protein
MVFVMVLSLRDQDGPATPGIFYRPQCYRNSRYFSRDAAKVSRDIFPRSVSIFPVPRGKS